VACLEAAEALGYIASLPSVVVGKLDRVIGTLVRVSA
jgi:hypothetical protein